MKLRLLRIFLGLAAITWGAAIPGVFLSWDSAVSAMEGLGAQPLKYDPMLDYWLRMATGAFGVIACVYLLPMFKPHRYWHLIPWLGGLALGQGMILLFHGLRLGLRPWPFIGDVSACFLSGIGILFSWRSIRYKPALDEVERAGNHTSL